MTSQPPLIDQTGISMPGPQFTPRPGWGGQLSRWFSRNGYVMVFRLVLLCACVLIAHSLWSRLPSQTAEISSPVTPTPTASSGELKNLTIKAESGDGMAHLAARALDLYIAVQPKIIRLDEAQHLYAVDALARLTCLCELNIGQTVTFESTNIASAITDAQSLTQAQHAAWQRLAAAASWRGLH